MHTRTSLLVMLATSLCFNVSADEQERGQNLTQYMTELTERGRVSGGVTLLAVDGQVVHEMATGLADIDSQTAMRPDHIFRIASMTKPVTTVAALMLMERGLLGLDDPVAKYLPEFARPAYVYSTDPLASRRTEKAMTIRHLLTHTSGLGYTSTRVIGPLYYKAGLHSGLCTTELSLDEFIRKLARMPLLFEPGERFQYGSSTDVLGRVVEVVAQEPLDRFIAREICLPLKMRDTSFRVSNENRDRLVTAYRMSDKELLPIPPNEALDYPNGDGIVRVSTDYPYNPAHKCLFGGGGLNSTANDYFRFCQMLLNRGELEGTRLLRKETVDQMVRNQIGDKKGMPLPGRFGLGMHLWTNEHESKELQGAFAWFGFWSTSFRVSPKGNWVLVTMAQTAWNPSTVDDFMEFEKRAARR